MVLWFVGSPALADTHAAQEGNRHRWIGSLPVDILPMANSMQHHVIANDIVADPIITNASPPLAGLHSFQFSSSEGIFFEPLYRGFSSTSEGWGDFSKVNQKGLGGDEAKRLRHAPYPYASEFSEYPPSCRHRLVCTPP